MALLNDYLVYIHKNKINNKVYIGQTCQEPQIRWKKGHSYKSSPHFYAAIQKYGWDNFQHIIVKSNLSAQQADELETKLIQEYNATDPNYGYNIRNGGQHGYHYTEQQKQQLSKQRRQISHNSKCAQKVRCKQTGDVFGTIADAQRWANTTHIWDAIAGRRFFAGRHPVTGQKLSWEYASDDAEITCLCKEKIDTQFSKLENNTKKVLCINTGEIFFSYRQAANWCGLKSSSNIGRCCRGERQSAGKHPQTGERLCWKEIS